MNTSGKSFIATSRFRISVHALVWLAVKDCVQSSASLAGQINSQPAFLRRVLLPFVQSGIVEAREGRDGGYMLKVPPEDLTVADIFLTVNSDLSSDFDSAICGEAERKLDEILEEVTHTAEHELIASLSRYTLADLVNRLT